MGCSERALTLKTMDWRKYVSSLVGFCSTSFVMFEGCKMRKPLVVRKILVGELEVAEWAPNAMTQSRTHAAWDLWEK